MPFNEYVGRSISLSLSRAMRQYNVSPADFRDLEEVYGENDVAIEDAILRNSPEGYFNAYKFWNEDNHGV